MGKKLEKIVVNFTEMIFGKNHKEVKKESKDVYVLSSVFPTRKVMNEVKKYL